jgi:hypothetical protein
MAAGSPTVLAFSAVSIFGAGAVGLGVRRGADEAAHGGEVGRFQVGGDNPVLRADGAAGASGHRATSQ